THKPPTSQTQNEQIKHKSYPVSRNNEKRQKFKVPKTHSHADPVRVTRSKQTIQAKGKQDRRRGNFQGAVRQADASHENRGNDYRNGERVPQHDRRQRTEHCCALLFLQPQRHGEQPTHGGVDAVKNAEPKDRQPRPELTHGKQKESLEESPPSRRT